MTSPRRRKNLKCTTPRRGRPVSTADLYYEAIKAGFVGKGMTPAEYAQACRRAAKRSRT